MESGHPQPAKSGQGGISGGMKASWVGVTASSLHTSPGGLYYVNNPRRPLPTSTGRTASRRNEGPCPSLNFGWSWLSPFSLVQGAYGCAGFPGLAVQLHKRIRDAERAPYGGVPARLIRRVAGIDDSVELNFLSQDRVPEMRASTV